MQETLRRMREKRADGDRGFTLIELLVVVVIIGVLVGIAIPVYMNYTKGAEEKAIQSDVRNAVTAIEQCYTNNGSAYPASQAATSATFTLTCSAGNQRVNVSEGVTLTYTKDAAGDKYTVDGAKGGTTYTYNSSTGKTTKS
jgi:type IV pilus assembly protein PilA